MNHRLLYSAAISPTSTLAQQKSVHIWRLFKREPLSLCPIIHRPVYDGINTKGKLFAHPSDTTVAICHRIAVWGGLNSTISSHDEQVQVHTNLRFSVLEFTYLSVRWPFFKYFFFFYSWNGENELSQRMESVGHCIRAGLALT